MTVMYKGYWRCVEYTQYVQVYRALKRERISGCKAKEKREILRRNFQKI